MKIYLGVGGSLIVHRFAVEHDCGWLLTPYNKRSPPTRGGHILDNGKFAIFLNGIEGKKKNRSPNWKPLIWDPERFRKLMRDHPGYDFVVVPDVVCAPNPQDSLDLSTQWVQECPRPRYLAVQDGMTAATIIPLLDDYDGIFVGGSIPWKMQTMRMWCDVAHLYKKKCHVGRVGTWEAMIEAHFVGADSIDTTSPSRHQDDSHIRMYKEALETQTILIQRQMQWIPELGKRGCQ
jgi:hypothetical protein